MKTFKDAKGRSWEIKIDVSQVKFVRAVLQIDLFKALADDFKIYNQITSDPVLLVDLLYCLCKSQAEKAAVSDEEFGRAMAGDAIMNGVNALTEELIDFFPDGRTRAMFKRVMEKAKELGDRIHQEATAAVERLNPKMIHSMMMKPFIASPAPSESTPTPSRFANWSGCTAAARLLRGITRRRSQR